MPTKPLVAAEVRRLAEAKVAMREARRAGSQIDDARLIHELEVHQVELEMQVEALQEARAELEAEARRHADLYDSTPVGYFTLETDGAIRELNLSGARLLGNERAVIVGRRFGLFVTEASRSEFSCFLGRVFATRATQTCDVELEGDGRPLLAVTITATVSSDARECCAVVMDLSERNRLADRLARLQSMTAALSGPIAPTEAADVILSLGLAATGGQAGIVTRAVDNGRWLEILREVGDANTSLYAATHLPTDVVASRTRFSLDGHNPISDAVNSRSAVWLQNRSELHANYPEHGSFFEKAGYHATVALPLLSRGELIGALRLSFLNESAFDAEYRAFLTAFAEQCALALDRAQLREEALTARALAERATTMRDHFLSVVAHDLGNPMNTIGIWAQFVVDTPLVGEGGAMARKGALGVQKAVRHMALLLHDLQDVTSIDSGCLRIHILENNAEAIVADVVEAYTPLCIEKGLVISGEAAAITIPCDRNRVQQVLGNLIANAIKFTPSGGAISVVVAPVAGAVHFSVADTGPGIPEGVRERVFERYWRGTDRDVTKGVGLGLFIVKGIIASHGGKIWVESTVGCGSTFHFTLPVGKP